jgi:hypothetical protein
MSLYWRQAIHTDRGGRRFARRKEREEPIMAREGMQNMELKETLDRNRFLEMLQGWTRAIEQNQDFEVRVNGQSHIIPADAIDRGRLRVEYEIDRGEYEFELTLKWR